MRNAATAPLAAALALSLAACAGGSGASREEAAIAAASSLPEVPVDWSAVAGRVGTVPVAWADAFNDPLLMQLIQEAQVNNRDLQGVAANVDRAWALTSQSRAALSPRVDLSAGAQGNGALEGGSSSRFNVGVQANWELDLWGRVRSGVRATSESAEAAELDYRYAQQSLAAAVARSYFLAIEAKLQEDVAQGIVDALTRTNRIVDVQFENGLANAQDRALTRTDLATARDTLAAAQGGRRDALRALEILLGRYPAADLEVRTSLPAPPPPPPAGLPAEILERRPDLVAAERRISAAIAGVDQANAAKLPQISLTSSVGGASSSLGDILNPANVIWSLASNLLTPIFDGGAGDAQVEVATAEQEQIVASYAQAALTAFGEVEQALDQGTVIRQREAALTEARTESEEALRLAQLRFDEGESDLLDVLTIQQRVFGAQSNLVSIRRSQLDQYVDLNLALGGSWAEPGT